MSSPPPRPDCAERLRPQRAPSVDTAALVVGLVGGVGCGKSTLADAVLEQRLEHHDDTLIVDGDSVGHEVRDQVEVRDRIVEAFGEEILGPDGFISREALAIRIFQAETPEQVRSRLDTLNGIMHPAMREEFIHRIRTTPCDLVLFDAAVLLEAGWDDLCHEIAFVDAAEPTRMARALADPERGWTEEQWRAREASQWPLDRKREAATIHLCGDEEPEPVAAALISLLEGGE